MKKEEKCALIFGSVHKTLEAEQCLAAGSWPFLLIPVPPKISQGCGLAIQIDPINQSAVGLFLNEHGILIEKTVVME
ncbi:DUF3343 domain-containing protein [Dehalobacter sp. DCM]|uniref:DUF3343 domain-containing protein n=1 Tax=Dehalobacter sp. DCM TaxID=2907827 RepID=UPI003081B30C|nr:DUF3343 domain-containing protein [Dehalobacter sp. DCM]